MQADVARRLVLKSKDPFYERLTQSFDEVNAKETIDNDDFHVLYSDGSILVGAGDGTDTMEVYASLDDYRKLYPVQVNS
jgi:hypothetical protein